MPFVFSEHRTERLGSRYSKKHSINRFFRHGWALNLDLFSVSLEHWSPGFTASSVRAFTTTDQTVNTSQTLGEIHG